MDHFHYRDGRLACEDIDLGTLAATTGTPTYVYSSATLSLHYRRLAEAFAALRPMICFSVKSCPNLAVLGLLGELGAGMDVVSGGELRRARMAGVPPERIVYAGVGKTDAEIREALGGTGSLNAHPHERRSIGVFNIESEPEFQTIAAISKSMGLSGGSAPVAALRVNPDVDPKTHAYTTTGKKETKFGVDLERARAFFRRFGRDQHLRLTGLHVHIGSPVMEVQPFVEALSKVLGLIDELAGEGYTVDTLDLGGGFGADYTTGASPAAADYAGAIVPLLRDRVEQGLRIIMEPGRTIAANAGVLLTRVLYVKESGAKKFIVCDAGMNTLMRPALYGSFHFIWPADVAPQHVPESRAADPGLPGLESADVVGPLCETGDFLAKDRPLPPVARGDLLAVFSAGAYGMSMASRYNSHPLPAEVLVDGAHARLVRRRETYDDLLAHEVDAESVGL
ncbi:MAG: diaminopimelate decarboxylase [Phycisphaeraceae bacterium]|nr:diaminopimelate decarboxylase [Phycisphaeraceae bacterium]